MVWACMDLLHDLCGVLLALRRQLLVLFPLRASRCRSHLWYLDNFLDGLHERDLDDLLNSLDLGYLNLFHNRDIDYLFDCFDHIHLHHLLHRDMHWHVAVLLYRDVYVVVHILDLRHLYMFLDGLHHGNIELTVVIRALVFPLMLFCAVSDSAPDILSIAVVGCFGLLNGYCASLGLIVVNEIPKLTNEQRKTCGRISACSVNGGLALGSLAAAAIATSMGLNS